MTEEISTRILDAAEARFRTYGFGKTTMAEIASDIDMSTANLYRYFENKLAIGSAMAGRCFCDRSDILKEIVSREGITESERLRLFVLAMLEYEYGQFSNEPKLLELVDVIVKKRPDLVQAEVEGNKNFIAVILKQGCDSGEFEVNDIDETASFVLAAVVKFSSPFFITMYPIEESQRLAEGVVKLLISGLAKR